MSTLSGLREALVARSQKQLHGRPWLVPVRGESRGEGYCYVCVHRPLVTAGREEVRSRVPSPVRCCRPSRCRGARRGVLGQRSGYGCLLVSRVPGMGVWLSRLCELKTSKDLFVSLIFVYAVAKCYYSVCLFT